LAVMNGLTRVKLKETSCNPERLTGKLVSLFVLCLSFLSTLFFESMEFHLSNEPLADES